MDDNSRVFFNKDSNAVDETLLPSLMLGRLWNASVSEPLLKLLRPPREPDDVVYKVEMEDPL